MLKTNSKYLIIISIELNMYERGGLNITERHDEYNRRAWATSRIL